MLQRPFSAAVRVNASFWLLVLLAAIVSPLTVVAASLTAAALHELGHLAVMRYYGVSVKRFRLTALGAELDAPAARVGFAREKAARDSGGSTKGRRGAGTSPRYTSRSSPRSPAAVSPAGRRRAMIA